MTMIILTKSYIVKNCAIQNSFCLRYFRAFNSVYRRKIEESEVLTSQDFLDGSDVVVRFEYYLTYITYSTTEIHNFNWPSQSDELIFRGKSWSKKVLKHCFSF